MKNLLILFYLLGYISFAQAQVSYTYTYQQQAGNPGGLNQETDFTSSGWTILQLGGLASNQWSAPVNLPFTFSLFGQNFTQFRASANGLLTFGSGNGSLNVDNTSLPTSHLPDYTIACFWEAFTLSPPTSTNDFLQLKVFGTAPNRQCWIRWYSYEWGAASFAYFSVVLEEQGGVFHLVDHYSSINANLLTTTVGAQQSASFGVQAGSNLSVPSTGSDALDNSYYSFTPYLIPPEDIQPVGFVNLIESDCGTQSVPLTLRFTNQGQQAADTLLLGYALDGVVQATETVVTSLLPGDTLTHTFSQQLQIPAVGTYELTAWASGIQDDDVSNDSLQAELTRSLLVDQFPYEADFENGPAGWEVSGSSATWELGNPALQGAASGTEAWATNLNGSYAPFERSYLTGPCMDFSSLSQDSWVSMWLWWDTELNWDGLSLQASTDDGQSWNTLGYVGDGWYNASFIGSLPGGEGEGWAGQSNGWQQFSLPLPNSLIGQSHVRLRLAFAANGSNQAQGVVFDRLLIGTPPVADLGTDRFVCDGEVLRLTNAQNAIIQWSNGSQADSLLISHVGTAPIIDSLITVTLTNSLGLSRTDSVYISVAAPITAQLDEVIPVRCQGETNGEITLEINGGTAPFSAVWSNGSSGLNPANFAAGAYVALLTDANGCQGTADTITVSEPNALVLNESLADPLCFGDSSGSITALVSGGNGGYSWQWTNGDSVSTAENLTVGNYDLTVTDSLGCEIEASYTLSQPALLTTGANLQDASCETDENGSISLLLVGGTAPYQVSWTEGDTGSILTGLGTGSYEATVVDANGCEVQTETFVIGYQDSVPTAGFSWAANQNELTFADESLGAQEYEWSFGDGTSSIQAAPVHVYADTGLFQVRQIVQNLCGEDTLTQLVRIDSVGVVDTTQSDTSGTDTTSTFLVEFEQARLSIFPNPNAGSFILGLGDEYTSQPVHLQLLDLQGRQLFEREASAPEAQLPVSLPNSLPPGHYWLRVEMKEATYGIPIVIRY